MKQIALIVGALALSACASAPEPQAACASYSHETGWIKVDCSTLQAREEAAKALRSAQIQAEYERLEELYD